LFEVTLDAKFVCKFDDTFDKEFDEALFDETSVAIEVVFDTSESVNCTDFFPMPTALINDGMYCEA
jgi:hypothetical protein